MRSICLAFLAILIGGGRAWGLNVAGDTLRARQLLAEAESDAYNDDFVSAVEKAFWAARSYEAESGYDHPRTLEAWYKMAEYAVSVDVYAFRMAALKVIEIAQRNPNQNSILLATNTKGLIMLHLLFNNYYFYDQYEVLEIIENYIDKLLLMDDPDILYLCASQYIKKSLILGKIEKKDVIDKIFRALDSLYLNPKKYKNFFYYDFLLRKLVYNHSQITSSDLKQTFGLIDTNLTGKKELIHTFQALTGVIESFDDLNQSEHDSALSTKVVLVNQLAKEKLNILMNKLSRLIPSQNIMSDQVILKSLLIYLRSDPSLLDKPDSLLAIFKPKYYENLIHVASKFDYRYLYAHLDMLQSTFNVSSAYYFSSLFFQDGEFAKGFFLNSLKSIISSSLAQLSKDSSMQNILLETQNLIKSSYLYSRHLMQITKSIDISENEIKIETKQDLDLIRNSISYYENIINNIFDIKNKLQAIDSVLYTNIRNIQYDSTLSYLKNTKNIDLVYPIFSYPFNCNDFFIINKKSIDGLWNSGHLFNSLGSVSATPGEKYAELSNLMKISNSFSRPNLIDSDNYKYFFDKSIKRASSYYYHPFVKAIKNTSGPVGIILGENGLASVINHNLALTDDSSLNKISEQNFDENFWCSDVTRNSFSRKTLIYQNMPIYVSSLYTDSYPETKKNANENRPAFIVSSIKPLASLAEYSSVDRSKTYRNFSEDDFFKLIDEKNKYELKYSNVEFSQINKAFIPLGIRVVVDSSKYREELIDALCKPVDILHLISHSWKDHKGLKNFYLLARPRSGSILWQNLITEIEIRNLPIKARLVVLSSCESTSFVSSHSFGPHGLAQAFLQGGAQMVLGSRWKVDDRAAVEFMKHFYTDLARDFDPDLPLERVRQAAQHAVRQLVDSDEFCHPFYWAGWELWIN